MTTSPTGAGGIKPLASDTTTAPGRRDPEARKQAILRAAAEMIVEQGVATLTHRAVATRAGESLSSTTRYFTSIDELRETAMERLAGELEEELSEVARALSSARDFPESCATLVHDFLLEPRTVRASVALLTADSPEPRLRELARDWSNRFRQILARHVGEEPAHALESYLNGLTVHAALFGAPASQASIATAIRALLTIPATRHPGK